ncbi:sodium/pantothenate symporter [Anaerosphaera aminiphila DSM 21120]|uniref:Sodium/pantothenate symporter n=1 Tax=Anaerosphaera aminiphila DSM 21120 TaxID=1120995 RepID=A0A1M5TUU7_9FIRM|nr:sodium/pantothenate symporter [Anaerosphaera aminiphila]SHH54547.1 sodium/pantothenate symporter [Anaerosphaera aminiphila DSM 21120]
MNKLNLWVLLPIAIYFCLVFFVGVIASKMIAKSKAKDASGNALSDYLTGGRDLGGFVLALTLVSTYLSAGSFIGGPGVAFTEGFSWIFLAMAQMPTGYFAFLILGKRFAIVSRKVHANTINDFLRARYQSDVLVLLTSIGITAFMIAAISAQWIGAARLLQGSIGLDYRTALAIFAIIVVVYTTLGGFRGVVYTDILQGAVMLTGTFLLLYGVLKATGGIAPAVQQIKEINPALLTPYGTGANNLTKIYLCSFWILVGFAIVGIPNVASRAMAYKDTKSLNKGIIYGMAISLILLMGMHLVGVMGIPVLKNLGLTPESGDLVIPLLATELFPQVLTGVVISGPLAAIMGTVAAQLLVANGSIVNDLLSNYVMKDLKTNTKKAKKVSLFVSIVIGVVVFLIALDPPELMVWLNLFSSGGVICTFIWPIVLGLYWKRGNAKGAIASVLTGVGSYIAFNIMGMRPLGMHAVVLPLIISFVVYIVVSLATPAPSLDIIKNLWGVYKEEKEIA